MKIESNISAVISRIERLKSRDIPQAMASALSPARWRELARQEATQTLLAIAEPTQREFIPQFIRTLEVEVFGPGSPGGQSNGFFMRMSSPFTEAQTLADFQAARSVISPSDLGQNLFMKDVTAFEDLMTEWVETEKRKDGRDAGKSDQDIGNFISYIMLAPQLTVREAAARQKLMPHIVDFLNRKQGLSRLEPGTVDIWLRAVLQAWCFMVGEHFPNFFKSALRANRSELAL